MTAAIYKREYWSGDSRDGTLINGEGYHFLRMTTVGLILEAYESYELDDGSEVVTPLPELYNVNWIDDLGFDDFETLDDISEEDFLRVKAICKKK